MAFFHAVSSPSALPMHQLDQHVLNHVVSLACSDHAYDDYMHQFAGWDHRWNDVEAGWGSDLADFSAPHFSEGGFLWLDAHILATPAVADIDADGVEDLVLAVSYFFDHDEYSDPVSACLQC